MTVQDHQGNALYRNAGVSQRAEGFPITNCGQPGRARIILL
jgi:hypothetical protein